MNRLLAWLFPSPPPLLSERARVAVAMRDFRHQSDMAMVERRRARRLP